MGWKSKVQHLDQTLQTKAESLRSLLGRLPLETQAILTLDVVNLSSLVSPMGLEHGVVFAPASASRELPRK